MAEAMRIRARATTGGGAVVRVLMAHEMETGLRKDAAGQPVPAWYIVEVQVALNGQPVLRAQWGTSVSKNPYLEFQLAGARAGDSISVGWLDNRGQRRSDETRVE